MGVKGIVYDEHGQAINLALIKVANVTNNSTFEMINHFIETSN